MSHLEAPSEFDLNIDNTVYQLMSRTAAEPAAGTSRGQLDPWCRSTVCDMSMECQSGKGTFLTLVTSRQQRCGVRPRLKAEPQRPASEEVRARKPQNCEDAHEVDSLLRILREGR